MVAVQGFGRFGPLGPPKSDSTRRYDLAQDWGVFLWLPLVADGPGRDRSCWDSASSGRPRRRPAGPWPSGPCLAVAVVTAYLPMAWDRYQLPIQAPAALLAAMALGEAVDRSSEAGSPSRSRGPDAIAVAATWNAGSSSSCWAATPSSGTPEIGIRASRLILTYAMVDRGTVCLDGLDRPDRRHRLLPGPLLLRQAAGILAGGHGPLCPGPPGPRLPPHPRNVRGHGLLAGRLLGHPGHLRAAARPSRQCSWSGCAQARAARRGRGDLPRSPTAWPPPPMPTRRSPTATSSRRSPCSGRSGCSGAASDGTRRRPVVTAGFLASWAAVDRAPGRAGVGHPGDLPRRSSAWPDAAAGCPGLLRRSGRPCRPSCSCATTMLAFGSPWDMGYFHHATAQFARVHSRAEPARPACARTWTWSPPCSGASIAASSSTPRSCCSPLPGWFVLVDRRQVRPGRLLAGGLRGGLRW